MGVTNETAVSFTSEAAVSRCRQPNQRRASTPEGQYPMRPWYGEPFARQSW